GHETLFEVDGIACSQTEYSKKVNELINEELLKILINPNYFTGLKWEKQREYLVDIAGDISWDEVVSKYKELEKIKDELERFGIDDLMKKYKLEISKVKKSIGEGEIRMDECERKLVNLDFKELREQLKEKRRELELLTGEERVKNERRIVEINEELDSLNRRSSLCEYDIIIFDEKISSIKKKMQELRDEWEDYSSKEYEEMEECPFCQREFSEDFLALMNLDRKALFEERKEEKFKEINLEGMELLRELEIIEESRRKVNALISKLDLKSAILMDEIDKINLTLNSYSEERNVDCRIFDLTTDIDKLKHSIGYDVYNKDINTRMAQIEEGIAQNKREKADFEQKLMLCERFVRCKISMLEDKINSKFSMVKFKLFHEQINGGIMECCECTYNGVPFSVLNTAARVNCGLDIINAFGNSYGVSAFVFIDGRESVNEIIDVDGQVINLVVTRDEELVIDNGVKCKREIMKAPEKIKKASIRSLNF
ncbi:MAG: hypothetical protein ACRC2K_07910, partial [Clostridium sp.]